MADKQDVSEILLRRKMKVINSKSITIPIDVIEYWGGKAPREVVFTALKEDGRIIVTIEPAIE